MTANDVLPELREIIVEVLDVEPGEVVPSARWEADLGGESIELLELSFRCERLLKIRMRPEEMFDIDDLPVDTEGQLTAEAIRQLVERNPDLATDGIQAPFATRRLKELITVGAIQKYVLEQMSRQRSQAAATQSNV